MSPLAKEWLAKGLADLATAECEMRAQKKSKLRCRLLSLAAGRRKTFESQTYRAAPRGPALS
jgi:hypothetical protein